MPTPEHKPPWNVEGIAERLNAAARPIEHEQLGLGVEYILGDTGTSLWVFPNARPSMVRVMSKNLRLELDSLGAPSIDEHGVVFHSGQTERPEYLRVGVDGEVFCAAAPYTITSGTTVEAAPPPIAPVPQSPTPLTEERPAGATELAAGSPAPEKDQRIAFQGRLAYDPRFHNAPRSGALVAELAVAEHPDNRTTVWHNHVEAHGEHAQRVDELGLKKGDQVRLVVYKAKVQKVKDGKTRFVEVERVSAIDRLAPQARSQGRVRQ